ncbi:MAG: diphosphate--fructose-6-phosphate 1-phosphotransferase [Bryobacteraceae bacterium]
MRAAGHAVIAQGGGPTAVINASLYGAVAELAAALPPSSRILGAEGGVAGVFRKQWIDLRAPSATAWEGVRMAPGAALGSCRKMLNAEEAAAAVEIFRSLDVRRFFYIGGNDSMDTALKIGRAASAAGYELFLAGIPKTIDNDLPCTDHCPGFGSAARYFAQSVIDLGMDIRALPTPVSILEVLGRNAGWLAAATCLAREKRGDAPHLIYVPEAPLSRERFLKDVEAAYKELGWVVAAVSEGVVDEKGHDWAAARGNAVDGFGHALPGDVAASLAAVVRSELGIRARSEKPGLCGRSSALLASTVDREEAEAVGRFAARSVCEGRSGFMAAILRESNEPYRVNYSAAPLEEVANVERKLPAEFIAAADIKDAYRAYAAPLIGGPLTRYAALR